jgi:mono/diheme cytochrome c family protein
VVAARLPFLSTILAALFALAGNGSAAADAPRTVLDGVYSQAQATRGRNTYRRHCKGCHLDNLLGDGVDPPLTSSLFIDAWREDYLASLFDFVSTRMPRGRNVQPGSLKTQEYLDIVAYILAYNEYPAGSAELKLEDLGTVMLVGTAGPAPLPPSAMMRTVGCFQRVDADWRLLQAATPARVRDPDETNATNNQRLTALGWAFSFARGPRRAGFGPILRVPRPLAEEAKTAQFDYEVLSVL